MKCRNCGMEVDGQTKFCTNCGSSLEWIQEEKNKKSKKNVIVVSVLLCVLLGAAGVGYKFYMDAQKKAQTEWNAYADELKTKLEKIEKNEYNYILTDEEKTEYEKKLQNIKNGIFGNAKKAELEQYEKEMNEFIDKITAANQTEIINKKEKLENVKLEKAMASDESTIDSYKERVEEQYKAGNFQEAMEELKEWEKYIDLIQNPVDTYRLEVVHYDLEAYPNVRLYLNISDRSGNYIYNLDKNAFLVSESSKPNGSYKQQKILDLVETSDGYCLEYEILDADEFLEDCYSNIYVRTQDGEGGYIEQYKLDKTKYVSLLYEKYIDACVECQEYERTLLDSDLILKSQKNDKNTIAYQSQKAIDEGGTGSAASENYMEKDYCEMLNMKKKGKEYIVYGIAKYNMTLYKKFGNVNQTEKAAILDYYMDYNISSTDEFRLGENISNYEKLTLVKDTDGKWKFNTRSYEREDGKSAVMVNKVYDIYWQ